ncbi:MAG: alpha/beta hydrolase [Syntrophobacteraceae bacterium]
MHVYKAYDQAALDAQYNNRAKVADFEGVVRGWAGRSEAFRKQRKGFLNVPYGPGEREKLDIFPALTVGAPLHVFFHGGYWQAMDKSFFHFLGEELHRQEAHVAFVNYPLMPRANMDAVVAACRSSVAWLFQNGHALVGDLSGIYVSGHSAGGHLVGMLMATDWEAIGLEVNRPAILGGCALSGLFDLEPIRLSYLNGVLRLDRETVRRNSPILLEPICKAPLLLVTGASEPDEYQCQSDELKRAWERRGVAVARQAVPGADHFSILEALANPDSPVLQSVLRTMGLPVRRNSAVSI